MRRRLLRTALLRTHSSAPAAAPVSPIGVLFPGQGSQRPGMGRDLYQQFALYRAALDEVDQALGEPLSVQMMRTGSEQDLAHPAVAQPAVLAHSIGIWRVLVHETGLGRQQVAAVMGHSLGEFTALCAAGSIPLGRVAVAVRERGRAMYLAMRSDGRAGSMAALMPCAAELAAELAAAASSETGGLVCQVANVNSESQVVISGHAAAVERACSLGRARGVRRAVPLKVGAPYHCSLMGPALPALRRALDEARPWLPPQLPVVTNVTGRLLVLPHPHPAGDGASAADAFLPEHLAMHMLAPVMWHQSTAFAVTQLGVSSFLEVGPAEVLGPLVRGYAPGLVASAAVTNAADLAEHLRRVINGEATPPSLTN